MPSKWHHPYHAHPVLGTKSHWLVQSSNSCVINFDKYFGSKAIYLLQDMSLFWSTSQVKNRKSISTINIFNLPTKETYFLLAVEKHCLIKWKFPGVQGIQKAVWNASCHVWGRVGVLPKPWMRMNYSSERHLLNRTKWTNKAGEH